MRKTSSALCTLDHEKGVSSHAASYKCLCLFKTSFQTSLCKLVHVDTMSQSNISYRVDDSGNRRRREKRRQEVERREILCASLRASQNEPRTRTTQNADIHVVRVCAVATHVIFHRSHWTRKFSGKCRSPDRVQNADEHFAILHSRNACHDFTGAIFIQKFARKIARPRLDPKRGHTFCASLRSGNACHDFTTATLRKFTAEMPQTKTAPQTVCEPAQSKRM